jgi:hypothetical protein
VAAPIWASIAVLANARRVANGEGYLGDRMNYVLYDLGRNSQNEVFNDIISDLGVPGGPRGQPTYDNGGSGRIYRNPDAPGVGQFTPPVNDQGEIQFPLFDPRWPFGWIHPSFVGFDLATGWGTPKVAPLLERLSAHTLKPLNITNVKWEMEFREAITLTGPLSSPAAGFANGIGTLRSASTLDPTSLILTFTPTQQYNIIVTNFQVPVLERKPDGRFNGFASAQVTIELIAAAPSNAAPQLDPDGNPIPPPGDPNAPPATPGVIQTGETSRPPLGGHEIRTWFMTGAISIVGRVYKSRSGREHVRGHFELLGLGAGNQPAPEGLDITFRGDFKG